MVKWEECGEVSPSRGLASLIRVYILNVSERTQNCPNAMPVVTNDEAM